MLVTQIKISPISVSYLEIPQSLSISAGLTFSDLEWVSMADKEEFNFAVTFPEI